MGPRRLPELGNTLGKAIRNFKDAIAGVEEASYRKLEDSPSQQARSQSSDPSPNQTSAEPQKSTS